MTWANGYVGTAMNVIVVLSPINGRELYARLRFSVSWENEESGQCRVGQGTDVELERVIGSRRLYKMRRDRKAEFRCLSGEEWVDAR